MDSRSTSLQFAAQRVLHDRRPNGSSAGIARELGGTSERGEKYRLFFQALMDALREEHQFTRARKAQPQSWYSFSSGTRWFTYVASFAANGRARVELYIDSTDRERNKQAFDRLKEQKEGLESELETTLEWKRLENRRASGISVLRPGSIDDNQETLEEISRWMIDAARTRASFRPRPD